MQADDPPLSTDQIELIQTASTYSGQLYFPPHRVIVTQYSAEGAREYIPVLNYSCSLKPEEESKKKDGKKE